VKISICIPTYNRAAHLANCLNSLIVNRERTDVEFEVCVSDNGSTDNTADVVRAAQARLPIRYHRNERNLGIPRNFLNVVSMAKGDFAWLVGDDDLLVPDCIHKLARLIDSHPNVDFFYVNSFHLTTEYVRSFPQPFDTRNLPRDMKPFSSWEREGELPFLDLIDPRISFDFLGGMFLAVFRRQRWIDNAGALDPAALADMRTFSHFDNTFPHVKIFSRAFPGSRAWFNPEPLSVCLTGAREWAPMYPFVKSVRLVEALREYRRNGLPLLRYWRCRNFALSNFIPDFGSMIVHRERSGLRYVKPLPLLLSNLPYPNFYLSLVYFIIRKSRRVWASLASPPAAPSKRV
jgi:glycosyltransferase involved in cell wall biosynthesis